jgi:hypothetical protein
MEKKKKKWPMRTAHERAQQRQCQCIVSRPSFSRWAPAAAILSTVPFSKWPPPVDYSAISFTSANAVAFVASF